MITNNIIQRVFNIKYKNNIATAFTIEYDNLQYLVSCSHVFPFSENNQKITFSIRKNTDWIEKNGLVLINNKSKADILLIKLDKDISPRHPINIGEPFNVSGKSYFLGFPLVSCQLLIDMTLGLFIEDNIENRINFSYPFPFIKSALISTPAFKDTDGILKIYLDGFNNKGFSGGPAVSIINSTHKINIIGVIKGFLPDDTQVRTPMGNISFDDNSGIIEVHSSQHILDILDQNAS